MSKASKSRRMDNPDAADPDDSRCSVSAPRITIGVVENDTLLCEGLVALLNTVEEFDCIGAWNQAREALIALQELRPDVLLLDIRQLQSASMALSNRQSSLSPATRILLTMNCSEEGWETVNSQRLPSQRDAPALLPALQFEVWGIVCKERGFRWAAESIRQAYGGEHEIDTETLTRLAEPHLRSLPLDMTTDKVPADNLTLREWEVIHLIAQGYSNKDIAREMQLSYSTVKNYVSSILNKLQLDGRTQIALLAHRWNGNLGFNGNRNSNASFQINGSG